jgi:hypothetical protein
MLIPRNSELDLEPKAIVSYRRRGASSGKPSKRYSTSSSPMTNEWSNGTADTVKFDSLSLMPLGNTSILPEPDETIILYVNTMKLRKYGELCSICDQPRCLRFHLLGLSPAGFINQTSWRPALNRPLLGLSSKEQDAEEWGDDQLVVRLGKRTIVDLVVNNLENGDHPFHLVRLFSTWRRSSCIDATE